MAVKHRVGKLKSYLVVFLALCLSGCGKVNLGPIGGGQMGSSLTAEQRFTLQNLDGTVTDLSQVLSQKKAVLINFWATWCTYCVEEMPELNKMQSDYGTSGFTVLGVNVGESKGQVTAFVQEKRISFPIVLDQDSSVAQRYGLVGIPVSILADSSGKVLGEYHGFTPKMIADVKEALKSE